MNAAHVHEMKPDNIIRTIWRIEKKEKDAIFEARLLVGQKPHKIVSKVKGWYRWRLQWEKCLGRGA
jgi:hypothetical protein